MSFLIGMCIGEVIGCVCWQYFGTKIMTWIKGEIAVANDLRLKATVIEESIRAKV
jgi:hypothetical protein